MRRLLLGMETTCRRLGLELLGDFIYPLAMVCICPLVFLLLNSTSIIDINKPPSADASNEVIKEETYEQSSKKTGPKSGAGLATSAWPKFQGNVANTGVGVGSGSKGVLKWSFKASGRTSGPSIGPGGIVYVGIGSQIYALSESTGAKLWVAQTMGDVAGTPAISTDGTLYDAGYALDTTTGAPRTSFGRKLAWGFDSPSIGPDGTVYISALHFSNEFGPGFYALNGTTGNLKWDFKTSHRVSCSAALGGDGTVFIGTEDKTLFALNGVTGAPEWSFQTTGIPGSLTLCPNKTVLVSTFSRDPKVDAVLYAVNAATGKQKWQFSTRDEVRFQAVSTDGTIFVSTDNGVIALEGSTGVKKWSFLPKNDWTFWLPAVGADGTVYVQSNAYIYALDKTSGVAKWSFKTDGWGGPALAIGADGTIFGGTMSGTVYALK